MPELSGEFDVDADGRLLHPLYDSITVSGVPLRVVHSRVASVLDQQQAGLDFSLQPLLRVSVEGEVRQPRIARHPPSTTVIEAIAAAGGATERGRLDRVRLVRDGTVIRLDLRDPISADVQTVLHSGDRLIVDRRGPSFREYFVPIISVIGTAASIANLFRRR